MSEEKKKMPAVIVWENTGELIPIELDWAYIMQICKQALTSGREYVILPVEESQKYKPHRRHLVTDNKNSPKGLIQRDRFALDRYYPYASARFDAEELITYAAENFNAMSRADLERMADGAIDGISPEAE